MGKYDPKQWKDIYDRYLRLEEELIERPKPLFRFGKSYLGVSTISEQGYCEKKVEFESQIGKQETEDMRSGTEAHELLLRDSVSVPLSDAWEGIFTKELTVLREFYVAAKVNDYPIIGKIDALVFYRSSPVLLFEHKFSSSPYPWESYHIQARTYCYVLNRMGFDTSRLTYAIVVAPLAARDDPLLMDSVNLVAKNLHKSTLDIPLTEGVGKAYLHRYQQAIAESHLIELLDYWLEKRQARGSDSAGKCKACEFRKNCELSLYPGRHL